MYPAFPFILASVLKVDESRTDLLILIPALSLISFVAAGLGIWFARRLRFQYARTRLLAEHLHRMRDETRRRLSFLNAISHDLRTPLNGITLQTHILDRALLTGDNDSLTHAAAEIRNASALAAEILDALLQYARVDLDPAVTAPIRLKELLQQTTEPFRAAAEDKSLAFDLYVPEDLTLQTDRDKLQRILANLLDNAVKFTPHGSITVRVRPTELPIEAATNPDDSNPEQPADPPNKVPGVTLEITDTGDGIDPKNADKVFREFFQANNPSRDARLGLGLGLVIAQRLTRQLGGHLDYQSQLKKGTTFLLTLPQIPPQHAPESTAAD